MRKTRTLWLAALLGAGLLAAPAHAAQDFQVWLGELRAEAAARGVSQATLDAALTGVQPIPRVIELDRRQPEGTITFATYVTRVISDARVKKGREMMRQHRAVLEEVGRRYGVQPRFIVALWAIETSFGANQGGFKVVDALATLAHDGRRSAYFRRELLDALTILEQDHIEPSVMKGSWAGAMGQCQFMPSSFLKYAQDFNGDGRRDIWGTTADVFASAAKYLSTVGWNPDQNWGREVKLPKKSFDAAAVAGLDKARTLTDWSKMGVRRIDGKPLSKQDLKAALIIPDGPSGRAFLVYDNYRTIMDWNRSTYFATTVGLLADRIGDGR